MTALVQGFRCFTSSLQGPNFGGEPVWDGNLPADLTLDRQAQLLRLGDGEKPPGLGWYLCPKLSNALSSGGLWPDGRPSAVFRAEAAEEDVLERYADQLAVSKLRILSPVSREEIALAVADLSQVFGQHQKAMARSQLKWRQALSRPRRDPAIVQKGLEAALKRRGLSSWTARQYPSARDVWNDWATWAPAQIRDACQGMDEWQERAIKIARDHLAYWAACSTEDNPAVRQVLNAWEVHEVFLYTVNPDFVAHGLSGLDANSALVLTFAALQDWVDFPPDYLTVGLREAYYNGLACVLPTGPKRLGWAMAP